MRLHSVPQTLTIDTLENLQYLCVSPASKTSSTHALLQDVLVVGEQYHIDGVGVWHHSHRRSMGVEMTSPSMSIRPTDV